MIEYFLRGGPLMWPILLSSLVSVGVMAERILAFVRYRREGLGPAAIQTALRGLEPEERRDREALEALLSAAGARTLKRLSRGLDLLELAGRISPMLGLLGTVLGLTETFQTVSAAVGTVDPALLAGGIWEALITTVAGLFVAIPALVALHFFTRALQAERSELKAAAEEALARTLLEARRGSAGERS